jgi:hypothetical protein
MHSRSLYKPVERVVEPCKARAHMAMRRTVLQKLGISATQGSNFERIANFCENLRPVIVDTEPYWHYPKHERFRLAKRIEDTAFEFMIRSYALL